MTVERLKPLFHCQFFLTSLWKLYASEQYEHTTFLLSLMSTLLALCSTFLIISQMVNYTSNIMDAKNKMWLSRVTDQFATLAAVTISPRLPLSLPHSLTGRICLRLSCWISSQTKHLSEGFLLLTKQTVTVRDNILWKSLSPLNVAIY